MSTKQLIENYIYFEYTIQGLINNLKAFMDTELNEIQIISTLPKTLSEKLSNLPQFSAKAVLLSEKILINTIKNKYASRNEPLLLALPDGICFIFPFGVVVFINLSDKYESLVIEYIEPYLKHPFKNKKDSFITETLWVTVQTDLEGIVDNKVHIKSLTKEHLEIIANVLAKSVMLELYENTIASNFENVEPIATDLLLKGRLTQNSPELLKHIGATLLAEHNMVGKIEITEKPALLWEYVQLDFLYDKLIEDMEIVERQKVLDRKIELLSRTAQTSLDLLQYKHANRLEWYIIILIIASILLEGYAVFFHGAFIP